MTSPIQKFLTERGVIAPPPNRPPETYTEFWERTVRWLAAAQRAPELVKQLGPDKARKILNELAIGSPAFSVDKRFVPQLSRPGTYGFILLPGGCYWALQKSRGGCCAFCEFQGAVEAIAGDLPFSHEEFMALFNAGFSTMDWVDMVNVFTGGSFLNPGEIPMETQAGVAERVAAAPEWLRILRVESRVQYIVEETVKPLIDILAPAGKTLDIAIGLETQDDRLRNKVLRKGMGRTGFINAVQTAKRLGARVSTHIMLMPVAMTEGYAIQECVDSIKFAFETGVDEVLLQSRYSHDPSVVCPQLWSLIKVLQETASLGPVMPGRWEDELPPPIVWPKNCDTCTPDFMQLLEQWRLSLDPALLDEAALPQCSCRISWEKVAADLTPPK